jgi:hypothetical protein
MIVSSSSKTAPSPSSTVARLGTGMIQAASGAFPSTVKRITICSVRPSQAITDVSRCTAMWDCLPGIMAHTRWGFPRRRQGEYAGLISEPSCSVSRASTTTSVRRLRRA